MYNRKTAYAILRARMDRGGVDVPSPLEQYWTTRLDAAAQDLEAKGIILTDTVGDSTLVADYAAYAIKNRDNAAGMPEWLRMAIRQRWLKEGREDGS